MVVPWLGMAKTAVDCQFPCMNGLRSGKARSARNSVDSLNLQLFVKHESALE